VTRQLLPPSPGTPVIIEIPGAPVGKARPRVTKFGTFMPKPYVAYLKMVALLTQVAMAGRPPIDRPCSLSIVALKARPATRPATCPKDLWHDGNVLCPVKPDADNILGSIMDGLEKGGAYTMDSRVCRVAATTYWCAVGVSPRVDVYLESL
tara:strand:+ start:4934 stop:5386 length:453 start_codon:yes stop_codon:yes gene_type:complete